MVRLGLARLRGARGVGSACFVSWVICSCSLRDTSFLDSGPSASGVGGGGSAGMQGGQGGSSGEPASGGDTAAGAPNGGTVAEPAGGEAGEIDAGAGGMVEPVLVGAFSNCPARTTWSVLSNPTVAELQAVTTSLGIPPSQLQPEYAIDDGDTAGTATRFSTGRPTAGGEFISVDMGHERWVSGVFTKEASGDYGRKLEVAVSRDGIAFTPVATADGRMGIFEIRFAPVIARYVRLNQTGSTTTEWWSLHDYKVYCTADAVPGGGAGGQGGAAGSASTGGNAGASGGGGTGGTGGKGGGAGAAGKGGAGGT